MNSLTTTDGGHLVVVAAPSGAGKTSLVNALVDRSAHVDLAISHTTRDPRPGEVDGRHYHFVDEPTFLDMAGSDQFIEHARVFGNHYGTSRKTVQAGLAQGHDVILEIDWQGARQVRDAMPGCVSVFVLPPSRETLLERLRGRGQDSQDVIDRRMQAARDEISHYAEFDFVIVNDDFDVALADLGSIVQSLRLRRDNQARRHAELLDDLLD